MTERLEYEREDGRLGTVNADYVVYLSKPVTDPSGDETLIHLDADLRVTRDSMRTLSARLGDHMLWFSPVHSAFNVVVNARYIAALTKPNSADSPDDHTVVYLTTGETLRLEDALQRVRSLVDQALPDTEWIDYERRGSDYTECAVRGHLEHVSAASDGKVYLHLTGGCLVEALDPDGVLVREATAQPVPPGTVTARQRAADPEWRPYCSMCRHEERMEPTPEGFRCTRCRSQVDYDLTLK